MHRRNFASKAQTVIIAVLVIAIVALLRTDKSKDGSVITEEDNAILSSNREVPFVRRKVFNQSNKLVALADVEEKGVKEPRKTENDQAVAGDGKAQEPVIGDGNKGKPVAGDQGKPVIRDGDQGKPLVGDGNQGNPIAGDGNQSNPVAGDGHQGEPVAGILNQRENENNQIVAKEKGGDASPGGGGGGGDVAGGQAKNPVQEESEKSRENPHPFDWIHVPKDLCTAQRPDLFILAVVHSSPNNLRRRTHIRETWGSQQLYSKVKTVVVFALGMPNASDARVQLSIDRESQQYGDIIQENFLDSYKNLTYKGIMWLKFAAKYCPQAKYLLKVDDDIFVNIFNLVSHLKKMMQYAGHAPRSMICLVWYGMIVMRDKTNKWYVSPEEYPNPTFPPYCSGSAYILTQDIVRPMYEQSFKTRFMWVDDWYITGALVHALQANHTSIASLYVLKAEEMQDRLVDGYALFGHVGSMQKRYSMWKDILEQKGIQMN